MYRRVRIAVSGPFRGSPRKGQEEYVLTAARTLAFAAGLPRAHPGCWIAGARCDRQVTQSSTSRLNRSSRTAVMPRSPQQFCRPRPDSVTTRYRIGESEAPA
jgi:hypothetical protein